MTFFAEAPACGSRGQAKTACPPPPQAQLLLPKNRTHRLLHKPDNFRSSQQLLSVCTLTERWPLLGSGHFKVEMCARRSPTCARAYWTFRPSAGRQGGGGYQRFDA
jgi:hypothetical protein